MRIAARDMIEEMNDTPTEAAITPVSFTLSSRCRSEAYVQPQEESFGIVGPISHHILLFLIIFSRLTCPFHLSMSCVGQRKLGDIPSSCLKDRCNTLVEKLKNGGCENFTSTFFS